MTEVIKIHGRYRLPSWPQSVSVWRGLNGRPDPLCYFCGLPIEKGQIVRVIGHRKGMRRAHLVCFEARMF